MRVYLGADHAGFELKNQVKDHLTQAGHDVVECGAHEYDAVDDYPAFCIDAARRVVADPGSLGIVFGGSGNGVDAMERFNPDSFSAEDRAALRESLGIDPGARVIGFSGRLVRDKGAEDLANAWQLVRERFPDVHLVMVGLAETKDAISAETLAALQGDPRVHVLGELPDSSPWFSIFDQVVLPSYREGFPNVLLEAASMRLPVVATRIPGCTDAVIDGVTGTLVGTGDIDALVSAISRYLDDPALRATHGNAGRVRVLREFRREDIWEAICQEYHRLLKSRGVEAPSTVASGHTNTESVWKSSQD